MTTAVKIQRLMELQNRRLDGLKMARVTDHQVPIIEDPSSEILIAGGNRGSKSFSAALRFASIARDIPVTSMSGKTIDCRLPHQKDRPLIMWVIGDHLKHIGQNIHRFLFRPGMFWIIRDLKTNGWRSWNPVQFPEDWDRMAERVPSPPFIPDSEIDWNKSAWYHKSLHQFEKITLRNGTEIFAFASAGAVMQGVPVDEAWFDEDIDQKNWYKEVLNRLTDKSGRCQWSTIPRDECHVYLEVVERAEEQAEDVAAGHRTVEDHYCKHHVLRQTDNPFLPKKQKQMRLEQMSERDRLIRIEGVLSTDVIRIYQTFNEEFHAVEYKDPSVNDQVTDELKANNWEPPSDWCRYLTLDPGTQKPAILFCAIPPKHMWDEGEPYYIAYDEIYVPRLDAYQLAARVSERHSGQFFEQFFIDGQAARQKPMGFSWTIGHQYELAFEEENLRSRHGVYFTPGDPDFKQRSQLVHKAMRMRACGRPQLRIIKNKCPQLVKQLKTNVRKLNKEGEPLEEQADKQRDDVRVCLEYFMSRHPQYKEPPLGNSPEDPTMSRYHQFRVEALRAGGGKQPKSEDVLCGVTG